MNNKLTRIGIALGIAIAMLVLLPMTELMELFLWVTLIPLTFLAALGLITFDVATWVQENGPKEQLLTWVEKVKARATVDN